MHRILQGTLDSRPLVQLAGLAASDIRWPGQPMALYAQASVAEEAGSREAIRDAARVSGEE